MALSFKVSKSDSTTIGKIVTRALGLYTEQGIETDRVSIAMDITAAHANGNPLRLNDLLGADDFNFLHDVSGIARHIDRDTGKLGGLFSPRFSARSAA